MVITNEGYRLFIAVDGPDGCGKTTIVSFIKDYLSLNGLPALQMKALGEGPIGQECRKKLLTTKDKIPFECFLMPTAIAETYFDYVEPALMNCKSIVVDRWLSSFFAYQVRARKDKEAKKIYNEIFMQNKLNIGWPDLYFICHVDIDTAELRMNQRFEEKTVLDNESREFKTAVHKGFKDFAETFDGCVINIDCNKPITEVLQQVKEHINNNIIQHI